jgi:phospholipid/cholesterol/gamma-HCH transport system substrate-binding protein
METHSQKFKLRLGLFIAGGLILFVLGVFFIGKQKNMFNPVFAISADFYNISGLQAGNNIRFSGINVGTVDKINILNDSTVRVSMLIRKEVQQFIKTDCRVSIGSEGFIGDKLISISQGGTNAKVAKEGQQLESDEPTDTDAIMASLQVSAVNAEIITQQLAEIMIKINSGNGTLGKLIQDSTIAQNFNQTIENLKKSSKGLDENMEAAKHNFLLKGYYNKKAKAAEQKKEDAAKAVEDKKAKEEKAK